MYVVYIRNNNNTTPHNSNFICCYVPFHPLSLYFPLLLPLALFYSLQTESLGAYEVMYIYLTKSIPHNSNLICCNVPFLFLTLYFTLPFAPLSSFSLCLSFCVCVFSFSLTLPVFLFLQLFNSFLQRVHNLFPVLYCKSSS